MRFRYFEAPEKEMRNLIEGKPTCEICGGQAQCFRLDSNQRIQAGGASVGCVECLKADRFGFFHITDAGYLDETGLTWYGEEPETSGKVFVAGKGGIVETSEDPVALVPPPPPQEAVDELRRTPIFPTWNEVSWPLHCSDFMIYQGPWQPRNISCEAAQRGVPGVDLFLSMAGTEFREFWIDDNPEWGLTFHVFRCTRCRQLTGILDLD